MTYRQGLGFDFLSLIPGLIPGILEEEKALRDALIPKNESQWDSVKGKSTIGQGDEGEKNNNALWIILGLAGAGLLVTVVVLASRKKK